MDPAQLGWALLVIVAALVGGLAAAALAHASVLTAVIVSVVTGGLALLAVFRAPARPPQLRDGDPDAEPGRYPAPRRAAPPSGPPPGPGPGPAPGPRPGSAPATAPLLPHVSRTPPAPPGARTPPAAQDPRGIAPASFAPGGPSDGQDRGGPPAGHQTAVQLLPLPAQPGQPPPDAPWWDSPQAPPPSPGAKRAPAPDLSTYLASTFIAQCPRCGAFRLDIRQAGSGWDFRCEACAHTWTWQPGTPWPPVRVMPEGRRE